MFGTVLNIHLDAHAFGHILLLPSEFTLSLGSIMVSSDIPQIPGNTPSTG